MCLIQNRSDERILKSALVGIHDKTVNTERHECKFELVLVGIDLLTFNSGVHSTLLEAHLSLTYCYGNHQCITRLVRMY